MANTFLALPAPVSTGPGAAVDVSAMGELKTVTIVADPNTVTTIETSNQTGPTPANWCPIRTFDGSGQYSFPVACRFMRLNVSELGASSPVAAVGANDDGASFVALTVPVGNGPGAGVSTSSLGAKKTVQIGGAFGGTVNVEISEDGGTTYQTIGTFTSGGGSAQFPLVAAAEFMRVVRSNVSAGDVSQPTVIVGAVPDAGGGGGGGGNGSVQSFTFRPGSGLAGPSVWEEWAPLYAALVAARTTAQDGGSFLVIVDDSLSAATVPAGAYDLSLVTLSGQKVNGLNALGFDDGAVFEHCLKYTDIAISFGAYDGTNWPIQIADGENVTFVRSSLNGTGCVGIDDGTATVLLGELGIFSASSIEVTSGNQLSLSVDGPGGNIPGDSIFGDGDLVMTIYDSSSVVSTEFTALNGTQTFTQVTASRFWPSDNGDIKTADAEFQDFDQIMLCDGTQTFQVSLPDSGASAQATLFGQGRICIVKTIGTGGTITVASQTTTIDGSANFTMTQENQCTAFLYDKDNDEYRVLWNYFIAA